MVLDLRLRRLVVAMTINFFLHSFSIGKKICQRLLDSGLFFCYYQSLFIFAIVNIKHSRYDEKIAFDIGDGCGRDGVGIM